MPRDASHSRRVQRWDAARREFRLVVAAYDGRQPALRDDAAEAHAALGLIALDTASGSSAGALSAHDEYQAAARATTDETRRAFFLWMLGQMDVRLGRTAKAAAAFREALALKPARPQARRLA